MTFGAPDWFWALLLLPVMGLLFAAAERRGAVRLRAFVSPRLLPQLGATVNRFRRTLRFALLLLGLALAITALAKPRWGYTYEDVKRRGLDLLVAVDTSRSMLANDLPPNRLQRVKLASHDLLNELRGDRVGVIAFAGRAFLQAPLTIDYDAALETLRELDTNIIPEGGTNISEAINLAVRTFGKSAVGNRALIIFTDGEELAGDSVKVAQSAADAGVRIFTVGVGTPEGSLIPLPGQAGGSAFVKDRSGQVVKSKLDQNRLREIAQATDGKYYLLGSGPATMRQLYAEGLAQMQSGEIDTRTSRQPIERYQWPLAAAILLLITSLLINERKRVRTAPAAKSIPRPAAIAALLLAAALPVHAAAPGLREYRDGRYAEALSRFQETLREHPQSRAEDKLHFGAGGAAYKLQDYSKALESFSQALLSPDKSLQSLSHYNLGNTLYQRGEQQKAAEQKLKDWENALQHYDHTLKIDPENKEAKENQEFVQKKIEELKQQQEQEPKPSPSPPPKKDEQKKDQQQQQDQSGSGDSSKPDEGKEQSEQQQEKDGESDKPQPGQSPSPQPQPSPSPGDKQDGSTGESPSPSPGEQPSPTPGEGEQPSPSPGEGEEQNKGEGEGEGDESSASPTPAPSPTPRPTGDVKGAGEEEQREEQQQEGAEAEAQQEGQMSPQQAEHLLRAMREEEARVQLDERKPVRRVYNDW